MKFDYDKATFEDIDARTAQLIILDDGEMFAVLKAHLIIERILDTVIKRNLKRSTRLTKKHRLSFELKLDLVRSFDILPEKYISSIKALNKIRNNIAHDEDYELTFQELKRLEVEWAPIQKKAYKVSCSKGVQEATRIASLFLVWKCVRFIAEPKDK